MVTTLPTFFERIYVLSLPHEHERRARLAAHFQQTGLLQPEQVTWVDAVVGDMCPAPAYFRGGNGAWGCLQTHSRVVQDAAMQGMRSCLILEDDVVFHPQSSMWLAAWLPLVPANWEQLYLGGQHLQKPEELYARSPVWRARNVNRTHAYGLHQRTYARFLRHIHQAPDYLARNEAWHLDHQLGLAHEKGLWQTYCPAWWLAGQAGGSSSVSGQKHPARWWQPEQYARRLPFVYVPDGGESLDQDQKSTILSRVHFGHHLPEDSLVDAGLDAVASGYRGLGEWLDLIAREALELGLVPGLCHPQITRADIGRQWPEAQVVTCGPLVEWPDLAALGEYPLNSSWAPEPFGLIQR